ncbi:MAG: single-stranded DNA-binding protein [Chitinivibrionales bacterium]|nr:single-stranded DNA-binding protein [Chitinivibrionales bacterium]
MAGVNKVILIGNLGKDPEFKVTPGGAAVCTFSLATTERYNDRSGQRQDRTEWHNIVAWSKLAELANQYLKKGRSAYIEGRIQTRSWDDRDGNKKYRTEIVANQIQFLGSPGPQNQTAGPETGEAPADIPLPPQGDAGAPGKIAEDDLPF